MTVWSKGVFANGMAWSCYGEGEKVALQIPGGPGNLAPDSGWWGSLAVKPYGRLIEENYRVITVTRKRNMADGHGIANMADDYADLIRDEFNGEVDLVIGTSFGGLISQYLAANHPDTFRFMVVIVAGCRVDQSAVAYDAEYAAGLARGDFLAAGAALAKGFYPRARFPWLVRLWTQLFIPLLIRRGYHDFLKSDVLVEAKAEHDFDSRKVLPQVRKPVLLIGGDRDFFFPLHILEETERLIPNSRLKVYEGKTHLSAFTDARVGSDILRFLEQCHTEAQRVPSNS